MLLEEFDAEKYERTIREEGREEGIKEGKAKVNRLGILMTEAGRGNDFLDSLSDRKLQKKLFVEFGLEEEKQGSHESARRRVLLTYASVSVKNISKEQTADDTVHSYQLS